MVLDRSWDDCEINLIRVGLPVPTRTRFATDAKRQRIGLLKPRKPDPVRHEDRVGPSNQDRPEPEWWGRARKLIASGMKVSEVATQMGRTQQIIRYAVDEVHRNRQKARQRLAYQRADKAEIKAKRSHEAIDYKRLAARAEARAQWKAAGRPGNVATFYRRLDCL